MVLKFYMQHDQTAGLHNDRIQPGRDSKMATITKNREINKIIFFPRTTWYNWLKFCMEHYWDVGLQNYQTVEKSVAELGHSGLLPVYKSSFAKMPISQETLNRF